MVLQTRRYRRVSIYALTLTAMGVTLAYLLLIWPIFQPHDLSNAEVQRFLLSEDFKARTAPVFEQLKRYSARLRRACRLRLSGARAVVRGSACR